MDRNNGTDCSDELLKVRIPTTASGFNSVEQPLNKWFTLFQFHLAGNVGVVEQKEKQQQQ